MQILTKATPTAPKFMVYSLPGIGKGQPSDHLIPTPDGDKAIGDLKIGDTVFGADGSSVTVEGVYPRGKLQTYYVYFKDGSYLEVDGDHIWSVYDKSTDKFFKEEKHLYDRDTRWLFEHQTHTQRMIPLCDPLEYREVEHKIDPYLMGLYIADGYSNGNNQVTITKNDVGVVAEMYKTSTPPSRTVTYDVTRHLFQSDTGFADELKRVELCNKRSSEKFIPSEYLFDSVENRIRLLHGLMDGDGSIAHGDRKENTAYYSSTSLLLCEQVQRLVTSLGGVSRIHKVQDNRIDWWKVMVLTPFNPFGFSSEAKRYTNNGFYLKRTIDRITPARVTDVTCIKVSSEDHLYISDTQFNIVTHNTTLASKLKKSLILDIEGGANKINTPRTTQITKLEEFYSDLVELWKAPKREFDYIVIDTVDWLVRLVINDVAGIDKNHLTETLNRSNGGYGNGKQVLDNHVRVKLLPMLIALNKKGYGICLLAHADKKTMMDSDGTTIEQIAPKIDPTTLNAFMEWCDAIFFLKKDLAGDRVLQLESDSVAVAKNRSGLTGEWNLAKDGDINELLNKEIENE